MIEIEEDDSDSSEELEFYEDTILWPRHGSDHSMNVLHSPKFSCFVSPKHSRTTTQLSAAEKEKNQRKWSDQIPVSDYRRKHNACHSCAKNNNGGVNPELSASQCGADRPAPSISNSSTFSGRSCPSYHSDTGFFSHAYNLTGNADKRDAEDEFRPLQATNDSIQGHITMRPDSVCQEQQGCMYGVPDKSLMIPSDAGKQLPCHIMYVDDKSNLQAVKTFDDLSDFLCQAATEQKYRVKDADLILDKIIKIPLSQIVHYASIGEYLQYLYEDEKLKDVIIEVDCKIFSAHRVALACHSQYFRELFMSSKGKKIPFEIKLRGVSAEAFEEFLEFVYTGKINISPQIAADLIVVADYLKVESLQQKCHHIANNLPMDQALKLVEKSKTVPDSRVYEQVFRVIKERFSDVTRQEEFLWLDIDTLCQFLGSDELVVATEFEVFQGALRWIVHNIEERVKFTMRLMELVRFSYMTQDELFTCVETTNLLKSYEKFREIMLMANWIITSRALNREDPFRFPFHQPRKCYVENKCLIFKSEARSNNNTQMMKRDPRSFVEESDTSAFRKPASGWEQKEKKVLMELTTRPQQERQQQQQQQQQQQKQQQEQQQQQQQQQPIVDSTEYRSTSPPRSMTSSAEYHTLARSMMSTMEYPLPRPIMTSTPTREVDMTMPISTPTPVMTSTPREERIPSPPPLPPHLVQQERRKHPLPKAPALPKQRERTTRDIQLEQTSVPRTGASKIADILCIGGFEEEDRKDDVKFVERYDSQDNQWVHYSKLPEPRRHHAATTMGNKLFLIGGCDPLSPTKAPLKSCWELDLRTKAWRQIAAMACARSDLCVCSLFGMIYAIGGKDEDGSVLETVECYNPKSNTWFWVAPMNRSRCGATAAVFEGKVVVVGGCGDASGVPSSLPVLNSVESFDPKQNSWVHLRNLRIPRCYANLVCVNNRLFLCAGATRSYNSKSTMLTSLASIDEYQKTTDSWTHVTDLVIPRHCAGVTVIGDRIFIIGGISSTSDRVLQSIETFDTARNIWVSGIQELPHPAHWLSCVAVPAKQPWND